MPYFPNTTMDVFSYVELQETDAYGNAKKGYMYRETISVDFQASSRKDTLSQAGELLQDVYKLYIDSKVTINANDIFKDPEGNTYTIIGTPIVNNRFNLTRHIKVEVQKTNKPIKTIEVDEP